MDAFIEPTEKDSTDFYQFHLPVGFNGKARFVGTDEFGQILFSAVFDTAFSSTGSNDREGTALVIHSGLTKYDFYQVLRRKDIDQISFITQSNIKRLSYSYENYDKDDEPTYDIWPNLTDNGPDYTLYNTKYEAEHSDQVVVLGNEDTLNGGLTIFGTFYATAFEVPETEVANVRVKHQIYGGYDCNTGEYETCGTPGGVITYNQRSSSGECNVSWINGCPRQVVRKGVCYAKDGYDNECSYLTFETVKTKDSVSGTFEPADTDSLFDEAALASYEGKTSVASNLYPIKHLNCDTCVHGDITVECKVVTDCICSVNGLSVCSDYNITECAENKITNVTCDKTENISGSSFENITANKITCACAVVDCATNITLSASCKNRLVAVCGTEVECGLTVDKLKVTGCVDGRLEVNGDVRAHGQLISEGDTVVHGDLYVEGATITTTEKEVNTSGDYVTLREGNNSPLSNTEYSGIVVNNYQTGCMATLTSDSCGTWRVSDSATSSATTYADVSQYKNVWYDGLTQTTVTVAKGITKNVNAVELDNVAIDSGNYYHKNGSDWYGPLTIVSGQFDLGSIITDATLIAALEAQSADDLVYYNSVTIAVIDASTNQPLLTRNEETNLEDNDILVWDDTNKRAVSMTRPTNSNQTISSCIDLVTNCMSWCWVTTTTFDNIYPVGSIYMNYCTTTIPFTQGTWCPLSDTFLRATTLQSCVSCTGGCDTVTLEACHLPNHSHSGTVGCHNHCINLTSSDMSGTRYACFRGGKCDVGSTITLGRASEVEIRQAYSGSAGPMPIYCLNLSHTHTVSGNTVCVAPSFTGGSVCGTCGCSFDIKPAYTNVAVWYRES